MAQVYYQGQQQRVVDGEHLAQLGPASGSRGVGNVNRWKEQVHGDGGGGGGGGEIGGEEGEDMGWHVEARPVMRRG